MDYIKKKLAQIKRSVSQLCRPDFTRLTSL